MSIFGGDVGRFFDDTGEAARKALRDAEEAAARAAAAASAAAEAAAKAIGKVATDSAKAAVAPATGAIDIFGGKPISQVLHDQIELRTNPAVAAVDAAAATQNLEASIERGIAAGSLGSGAGDVVTDIERLLHPIDPNDAAAVAHATQQFIETGDVNYLNPASVLLAAEIVRCRNMVEPLAHGIPEEIKSTLNTEFLSLIETARYLVNADVPGSINLPNFAIRHLDKASAITLVDIIVFKELPSAATPNSRFLWMHELTHVKQYRDMGIQEFCKKYIAEEISFHAEGDGGNNLETDADRSACRFEPTAQPAYLKSCPAP